jgi:hypothetical protein
LVQKILKKEQPPLKTNVKRSLKENNFKEIKWISQAEMFGFFYAVSFSKKVITCPQWNSIQPPKKKY